jgi:hypothetical protein
MRTLSLISSITGSSLAVFTKADEVITVRMAPTRMAPVRPWLPAVKLSNAGIRP